MAEAVQLNNSEQNLSVAGNTINLTQSTLKIQTVVTCSSHKPTNQISWQACCDSDPLPPDAVLAGYDTDDDLIFVGQACHNGLMLPAKIIPAKQCAYIAYDGEEFQKKSYKVLCCSSVSWFPSRNGSIPPNAIEVSGTAPGETMYIGRGFFNGSLTPGKVIPKKKKLYIPYGNCEVIIKRFEILVAN